VFVPILIELACIATVAKDLIAAERNFQRVHHVKNTLMQITNAQFMCLQTFFILSDPSKHFAGNREKHLIRLMETFRVDGLGDITAETNPELKDVLERSEELRRTNLKLGEEAIVSRNSLHPRGLSTIGLNSMLVSSAMETQKVAQDILRIESSLIESEPDQIASLRFKFIATILIGFSMNVVVSVVLLKILIGQLQNKLTYVTKRAELLALGQPLPKGLSGKDELSEVDRVIMEASNALAQFRWTESAILDNAADAIFSLDDKMRFQTVGASSAKVLGYTPEELERKSVIGLVAAESIEFTRTLMEKIREGTADGKFENCLVQKDGSLRDALWTVTWSSEKQSYFCVVNDVTEIRNVDRMKKRFMAMVSHDIRSPLTSVAVILTTTAAGKRGELDARAYKEIERANGNSQRLLALVNDFLELEKLEAHKFALDLGAVAASEVCNVARDSLSGLAQAARVTIVPPKGDAILQADERRIIQVLINLLSNAIKFSPPNSTVRMTIESDNEYATIRVIDEGPGIAPEEQQIIFDKFQQTRLKSQINMKGTGLGLAIVKNIVEAHGGRVGVSTDQTSGSAFWITIPAYHDEEDLS